ncbi:TniQ family protein [Actinacidiphila oryziradicis]|uniref:TniQ domain-containing protein n=1 Tax=Actinacidiphila oryziradicis TaxID=2571141 RepID=A0A4U0RTF2_9ACTN|nr:TniQ family protein [Actinacidiphila oryziradicis]TJZ99433.1 hypothetical protein FCI23_45755 [Actinacidiphila oryziradicis]
MNSSTTAPKEAAPSHAPAPAAAWAAAAHPAPGVFRVRPLPGEATASYLTRLAHTWRLPLPDLLDGLGIHLATGPGSADGTTPSAELHLNTAGQQRLSAHARIPHPHLLRALPRLSPPDRTGTAEALTGPPAAHWQPTPPALQPFRACTTCVQHRSHGTATTAWAYPPAHTPLICTRHQQAGADPRHTTPLDIRTLPELTHAHQRLTRPTTTPTALTWAATITTRWYDHHQHLNQRWQTRLARLTAANPHTRHHGTASPTLTCRTLVTYPETLTLAAALTHIPPHGLTRTDQTRFLQHLANKMGLPRLAPATHDPLWARLHRH